MASKVEFYDGREVVAQEGREAFQEYHVNCPYSEGWERDAWWDGWESGYYGETDYNVRRIMWDKRYARYGEES